MKLTNRQRDQIAGISFVLLPIIGIFLFVGIPLIVSLVLSFGHLSSFDIFDIDFTKVSVEALGVKPLTLTNTLDGIFTKEKDKSRKFYNFYMEIGSARLVPTESICEKLFACKGNKIFHTPLEYIVDAEQLCVVPHSEEGNKLHGKVTEILDYGHTKYAKIDVDGQTVTAAYDGAVGDEVDVTVPVEALTIKDKSIDIIIV